jgi:ABC-type nitrate/sulfonate/bicarbonate transport system substrate-binding protein
MTDNIASLTGRREKLDRIWFTRCPVPTASGIAYSLGWLDEEFGRDGLRVEAIQDAPRALHDQDNDNRLFGVFREGGNIPALAERANGAPTCLIGLTWIDEWQAVLVRKDTGPIDPVQLKGLRVALPAYSSDRGRSIARGMSLAGIKGALGIAGLGLEDVTFVDVPLAPRSDDSAVNLAQLWSGIDALAAGKVDAVYVKGASAVEAAIRAGVVVGIDLDAYPSRLTRVNNGTPRPITVDRELLDNHFDLVVRFLETTLRAADWAANNLPALRTILQKQTYSGAVGVETAYRNNFHRSLHPDFSDERIDMLKRQASFLWLHGFLEHHVDVEAWIDRRPLEAAYARRTDSRAA